MKRQQITWDIALQKQYLEGLMSVASGGLEMEAKVLVSWKLEILSDLLIYLQLYPVLAGIWHSWLLRRAFEFGIGYC